MSDQIDTLLSRIEENGEEILFEKPVDSSSITKLEEELDVVLPPTYRSFLQRFGAAHFIDRSVSGITDGNPHAERTGSTLFDTKRFRSDYELPEDFIVIQPNEELPCCLDTSEPDPNSGELPVVIYNLSRGYATKISTSFSDFFVEWFLGPILDDIEEGDI